MNRKKITLLSIVIILIISIFCAYNFSLKPQEETTSTNTVIEINKLEMLEKFFPKDININLNGISANSSVDLSEEDLTDFFIYCIDENENLKEFVKGINVSLKDNLLTIYANIEYKKIPLGLTLNFSAESIDGKGIFKFQNANIGFISISKETIFKNLKDTSLVQFDKENGDIILSFKDIKNLTITKMDIKNEHLYINFEGKINFWNN